MADVTIIEIDRNINDEPRDFIFLFGIYQKLKNISNSEIRFHFDGCNFLQQNAVAFLGALTRSLLSRQNAVAFHMDSFNPDVKKNLQRNGFLRKLSLDKTQMIEGNSIPYREDTIFNPNDYEGYLRNKWLGKNQLSLDEIIKDLVVTNVYEAYVNVFEHAQSPIGVISCGQYYPQLYVLKLALVAFGVGIPHKVRTHLKKPTMKASETLQWVFEGGNSTKADYGGNGLKVLKSFIENYHGKLEIYSDTGYACIRGRGIPDKFQDNSVGFLGTSVQIIIGTNIDIYSNIFNNDFDSSELFF